MTEKNHVILSEPCHPEQPLLCHPEHGVGASKAKHYGVVSGSQKRPPKDQSTLTCHPELVSGSQKHALKSKKTNKIVTLNSFQGLKNCKQTAQETLNHLRFTTDTGSHKNFKILKQVQNDKIFGSLCKVQHDKWAKPAFTLSGLLITVLVSSIILVALAPVISKRVTLAPKKITQTSIKGALFTLNEADLTKCNITTDVDGADEDTCTLTLPQSVTNINAVLVGFGGDGASAQQNGETIHVIEPFLTSQTKTYSSIMYYNAGDGEKPYYVSNLKIDYIVSGGAGGGAGWGEVVSGEFGSPTQQSHCDPYHALYIPAEHNAGVALCVTKYNVGDTYGPPALVALLDAATTESCADMNCCYAGQTADSSTCAASGTWGSNTTTYSSCTRTVCTYTAANNACNNWAPSDMSAGDWRLASLTEMENWAVHINTETSSSNALLNNYLGSNGLQFCDEASSDAILSCASFTGCGSVCWPALLVRSAMQTTGFAIEEVCSFSQGTFCGDIAKYLNGKTGAGSARCVAEEVPITSSTARSGAGGGAGAYLTNQVVHNGILNEEIAISITIGKGGEEGQNGEDTKVEYASTILITYGAKDDYFGADGTETDFGKASTITKRYTKTNSTQSTYNITSDELGTDGQSEDNVTTTQTATGGQGGSSAYEFYKSKGTGTPTYSGGAQGGNASDPNGKDATTPGAGGGGGTAKLNDDGTIEMGEGGNGADGAVIISYDLIPIPTAGAGGGGAPIAIGTAIPISSDKNTIKVSFDAGNIDEPKSCQYVPQLNFGTHASGENYIFCGNNSNENTPGTADPDGAIISNSLSQYFEIILGEDGESGGQDLNSINILGGSGGASGANTTFTCGGLNEQDCQKYNLLNTAINTDGSDGLFNPTPVNIPQGTYGPAGSGGGGGGYDATTSTPTLGQGGKGAQGYVYIWWEE